jgi:hypothetical protein
MTPMLGIMASQNYPRTITVEYNVVGGGGNGGAGVQSVAHGGPGGGGGLTYGTNVFSRNTNFSVTVGAGGGNASSFSSYTAGGGGNAGYYNQQGGGGSGTLTGATGAGFRSNGNPGNIDTITSTYRGGSGAGATYGQDNYVGGAGGGGYGGNADRAGGAGDVNTGGGGGAGSADNPSNKSGGAGGSGVVIFKYLTSEGTITIGSGLTGSTTTNGSYKITTITNGTGNVSWA